MFSLLYMAYHPHNPSLSSSQTVKEKCSNFVQKTYENRFHNLRRGRDLNPRGSCDPAGFRNRCLQPLSHLSVTGNHNNIEFTLLPIRKTPRRPCGGRDVFREPALLHAGHILGVRTLLALNYLESHSIADFELGKRDASDIVGMKEEVLRLVFARDETKSFISNDRFDCSCHGDRLMRLLAKKISTSFLRHRL